MLARAHGRRPPGLLGATTATTTTATPGASSAAALIRSRRALRRSARGSRKRRVLLLTGATGLVGSALLRRLTAAGEPCAASCATPGGSGPSASACRSRSATSPTRRRSATRCAACDTVVHLAAPIRDQPRGSIEELNAIATWRMVEAAERAGVQRFVFFCARRSAHDRTRFLRAKALAERAVARVGPAAHGLRAVDRLRARRPVPHAARAHVAAARDADRRLGPRAVPADLGRRRRRLRRGGARRPATPASATSCGPRDAHLRGDRRARSCAPPGARARSSASRRRRRRALRALGP